jgi:hypothetical protein
MEELFWIHFIGKKLIATMILRLEYQIQFLVKKGGCCECVTRKCVLFAIQFASSAKLGLENKEGTL